MQKFSDGTKYCPKCKCAKLETDFNKDKTKVDGLMTLCKTCKRNYRISPFYKSKEKELEKTQAYKDRKKRYNKTPLGKQERSRKYHRNKTIGNEPSNLILDEWNTIISNQGSVCAICGNPFTLDNPITRDCIIPLSKGGALTFENTQALCRHCNAVKHVSVYSGLGNRWRLNFKK